MCGRSEHYEYADKKCIDCGDTFTPKGPNTKACKDCRRDVKNKYNRDYYHNVYAALKKAARRPTNATSQEPI